LGLSKFIFAPVPDFVEPVPALLRFSVTFCEALLRFYFAKSLILKQCYMLRFFGAEASGVLV